MYSGMWLLQTIRYFVVDMNIIIAVSLPKKKKD